MHLWRDVQQPPAGRPVGRRYAGQEGAHVGPDDAQVVDVQWGGLHGHAYTRSSRSISTMLQSKVGMRRCSWTAFRSRKLSSMRIACRSVM